MSWLFPLHPRFAHFPVVLLLVGSVLALFYLLGWRKALFPATAWLLLLLGWVSLFVAILTGLIDRNHAPQDAALSAVLNPHIAAGFALLIVYGLLLYERLRAPQVLDQPRRRWLLLGLLLAGSALVAVEGALGGQLVFHLGVGVAR